MSRDALMDAAEVVFVRRGVAGASLEEIAAEAGFSRGAIYDHFGSKDDLVLAVADRVLDRRLEAYEQFYQGDDAVSAAKGFAELPRTSFFTNLVPLEMELSLTALRDPGLQQRLAEAERRFSDEDTRMIEKMLGDKANPRIPLQDMADLGRAAVKGLLQMAAVDPERRQRYEGLIETLFILMAEAAIGPGS